MFRGNIATLLISCLSLCFLNAIMWVDGPDHTLLYLAHSPQAETSETLS